MAEVLVVAAFAWIAYQIWLGYSEDRKPAPVMLNTGSGILEPTCPHCRARLVPLPRKSGGGFPALLAWSLGLSGLVFMLFSWLAGLGLILIAILLHHVARGQQTVLVCPIHGDIKTLS